jgi:epoxide hydrolase-like predicted phosphatase
VTPRGLVVDYGGVLTNQIRDTVDAFLAADGIDSEQYAEAIGAWLGDDLAADNPMHLLERGHLAEPDFERELAARLRRRDGTAVEADGLLGRMFAGTRREPVMVTLVRRAREAGIRTALLSNSWSMSAYDRDAWEQTFDAVVISGEVGMRKPDREIYVHTAGLLGLDPGECVFVDDLAGNVYGAVAAGMVGVHHVSAAATVAELAVLFGETLPVAGLGVG